MTIIVDGIEYEETVSAGNGGPVYTPVQQASTTTGGASSFSQKAPRGPFRILRGDSVGPLYMTGYDETGLPVAVTGAGWVCRSQVLDAGRVNAVLERAVTDTVEDQGVQKFIAHLTPAESEQLTAARVLVPTIYYWSVEIENATIGYRHSTEVQLAVLPKP